MVLLHVRQRRSTADFFRMLRGRPEALDLLIAYCKQQDLDLLKDIYYQAALPQESANIAVLEAYQNAVWHTSTAAGSIDSLFLFACLFALFVLFCLFDQDLDKRLRGLQIALNLFKDTKEAFAAKVSS